MSFNILDPRNVPHWDDILLSTPGYSFFHTSAWAKVLSESYGYTSFYFAAIENGRFRALVPLMEVNSFLTGKRGVSLPFTDFCEPIVDEGISFAELLAEMIAFGNKRGWKYLEIRGGSKVMQGSRFEDKGSREIEKGKRGDGRRQDQKTGGSGLGVGNRETLNAGLDPSSSVVNAELSNLLCPTPNALHPTPCMSTRNPQLVTRNIPPFATYFGHTLDLSKGEEQIFKGLRDSTRRNIRKAVNQNVTVRISREPEAMREFYRLNCMTRKEHGLPPQPFFFSKVCTSTS